MPNVLSISEGDYSAIVVMICLEWALLIIVLPPTGFEQETRIQFIRAVDFVVKIVPIFLADETRGYRNNR